MTHQKNLQPTVSELEILQILWDKGSSTVRDVHEILEKNKAAGYTTTLKLMQIMLEKGILKRNAEARTHVYTPAISQEKTQRQLVDKMIHTVFNGSSASLVMQALGNHQSTREEIEQIKNYLRQLEKPDTDESGDSKKS